MHQRLTNRLANPASGPEYSVPATGCAGTRRACSGRIGVERRDDRALDRTHVRDDRAWLQRRRDEAPDRLVGADRRAKITQSALLTARAEIVGDNVAKPQRFRALQDRDRIVGKDDATRRMTPARGARDR